MMIPKINGAIKLLFGIPTVAAGVLALLLFMRSIPTEAEVIEMIETRAPYVVDQKLILSKLMWLEAGVRAIHEKVDVLVTDVAIIKASKE